MSLKTELAKHKALWNKAKKMKPDFDNVVTDGVYVGKLVKAEVGTSESSGRLQVAFGAVITGGEFKGEKVNWWSGLKTEQNFMYLQRDLTKLGLTIPEDINELGEVLKEVEKEKPSIRFRTKTDGEFQNVRILKKLEGGDVADEDEEDVEDADAEEAPEEPETEEEDVQDEDKDDQDDDDEDEEEVEEEEDDAATLDVGVRVAFDFKGEEVVGEVAEIDKKAETAKIKGDNGKKYKGIKFDKLRPAPKAKVKKK